MPLLETLVGDSARALGFGGGAYTGPVLYIWDGTSISQYTANGSASLINSTNVPGLAGYSMTVLPNKKYAYINSPGTTYSVDLTTFATASVANAGAGYYCGIVSSSGSNAVYLATGQNTSSAAATAVQTINPANNTVISGNYSADSMSISLGLSPDNAYLVTMGSWDGYIAFWTTSNMSRTYYNGTALPGMVPDGKYTYGWRTSTQQVFWGGNDNNWHYTSYTSPGTWSTFNAQSVGPCNSCIWSTGATPYFYGSVSNQSQNSSYIDVYNTSLTRVVSLSGQANGNYGSQNVILGFVANSQPTLYPYVYAITPSGILQIDTNSNTISLVISKAGIRGFACV
jgi:hypothetical protein